MQFGSFIFFGVTLFILACSVTGQQAQLSRACESCWREIESCNQYPYFSEQDFWEYKEWMNCARDALTYFLKSKGLGLPTITRSTGPIGRFISAYYAPGKCRRGCISHTMWNEMGNCKACMRENNKAAGLVIQRSIYCWEKITEIERNNGYEPLEKKCPPPKGSCFQDPNPRPFPCQFFG